MEARATAHYCARELTKLGHEVRLMPAKDVKAYVKRNKNDAADAEAIWPTRRLPKTCTEAAIALPFQMQPK
jgi:transposase